MTIIIALHFACHLSLLFLKNIKGLLAGTHFKKKDNISNSLRRLWGEMNELP